MADEDDEAIDWAIRMTEPDADWDAFTTWLEGDAGRSARYDRAVTALQDAEQALAELTPAANDDDPDLASRSRRSRRSVGRWFGGAIAAALVGAVGLGLWNEGPRPYTIETAAGEQRTLTLADGSRIVLAGASAVRLDHDDPRVATVERGEMLFRVRHDADRPFAVQVGALRLVDLGTVFNVKKAGGNTRVAVAEGAVMVDPDGAALRLDPGQTVIARGASLVRGSIDPADIGGWQQGRLSFDGASLDEVAADLSRQLGWPVKAAPAIARRTFRGTLDTQTLKDRPTLLGQLLDVSVRQDDGGWTLEAHR
ncbi:FecR family protein [Sphingomonas sp. 1P08PE]|uniref:FecR family protein n=1 Tax=Sphingomonas sp. 1P08PE TaxID=554122 RepID=UPI0039A0B79C